MNYFEPHLTPDELRAISAIGLAHMGDAVYETLVRTWLCVHGKATGKELHRATIALVCAQKQAELAQRVLPQMTEEELAVYKRGRNAKSYTMAKNATMKDYRKATGFEALMGYLYLKGETERLVSLVREGLGDTWAEEKKEEDRA